MQDNIAIVLPVRDGNLGRRSRLPRCLDSYLEMTEGKSVVYLLHDADECHIYDPIAKKYPQIINYCIPTGITLMEKINVHALDIAQNHKYVGFIGDDIVFKTPFESQIIEHLSSVKTGMAFGNDMNWGPKLATHPFISSNAILAVGFFGCPAVTHNFFDNYWQIIFRELGTIKYFSDIIMEHMHPDLGKAPKDSISIGILNRLDSDMALFTRYMQTSLDRDINKIKRYAGLQL